MCLIFSIYLAKGGNYLSYHLVLFLLWVFQMGWEQAAGNPVWNIKELTTSLNENKKETALYI